MELLVTLISIVIVNCIYYLLFSKFSLLTSSDCKLTQPVNTNDNPYGVSLIVCAKNEAENLKKNIPHWLEQEYPKYEIILINDASIDDSLEVMESFEARHSKIQIVNVKNNETFWGNKKYALTLGIKKAKYKRLLFTDADCRPASNQWLRLMTSCFTAQKQLILGYGGYKKQAGLLNLLIRYETLLTAIQYFSYAKAGFPYMGVGRNLAYSSKLYYDNNGFMSHIKISSGDDDLFVNEVATANNTAICYLPDSFTYSDAKKSWKTWIHQKKRHVSTAKNYRLKHKFLLGVYYLFNLFFWITAILSFFWLDWKVVLIIIGVRFLIQFIVISKAALKLKEINLITFIPFLELFLVFMQMSIFISNSFSKPTRWK